MISFYLRGVFTEDGLLDLDPVFGHLASVGQPEWPAWRSRGSGSAAGQQIVERTGERARVS